MSGTGSIILLSSLSRIYVDFSVIIQVAGPQLQLHANHRHDSLHTHVAGTITHPRGSGPFWSDPLGARYDPSIWRRKKNVLIVQLSVPIDLFHVQIQEEICLPCFYLILDLDS